MYILYIGDENKQGYRSNEIILIVLGPNWDYNLHKVIVNNINNRILDFGY